MCMDVVLKRGREESLRRRHPWVFSGAIAVGPPRVKPLKLYLRTASGLRVARILQTHRSVSVPGRLSKPSRLTIPFSSGAWRAHSNCGIKWA